MSTLKFICVTLLIFCISCRQTENDSADSNQPKIDESIPKVTFYSKHQLDSILEYVNRDTSIDQNLGTGRILKSGEGNEDYYIVQRNVEGYVELHEQWDDVTIIRSGHGVLRTGRKVTDYKFVFGEKPWRSWSGGQIEDATVTNINPGDIIIIPAMTGHQFIPNSNDTLTYWTIKIKRTKTN